MQRLALYFDVGIKPWSPDKEWNDLTIQAWDELFQPGISQQATKSVYAPQTYVLSPIDGSLSYLRRGPDARSGDDQAIQEADISLESVSLQITRMASFAQLSEASKETVGCV